MVNRALITLDYISLYILAYGGMNAYSTAPHYIEAT